LSGAIRPDVAQAIVGAANEGIVVIDERGIVRSFNSAAERIFGHRASQVLGKNVACLMSEPHRARHDTYLARHLESGKERVVGTEREIDGLRRDGTVFPMELSLVRLEIDGRPHFSGLVRDVSERKESESFRAQRGRVSDAVNEVLRGFVGASLWTRKELFDAALEGLLALTGSEFGFIGEVLESHEGRPYLKAHAISDVSWNADTRRRYRQEARRGLEFHELSNLLGATVASGEMVITNEPAADPRSGGLPPGHPRLDAYMGLPVYAGSKFLGMVGLANRHGGYDEELADALKPFLEAVGTVIAGFQNLQTRRKAEQDLYRAQQRLRILATQDGLTEIPNRQSLMDAIDDAFSRSKELGIPFSTVFVDVDQFKRINDEHGHAAGDRVLRHVARLLRETIRPADIIGRYGGDEFVMAFLECDEPFAEIVAERLRLRIEGEPFAVDEEGRHCIQVTISAGVATWNETARNANDLVEWADRAVYEAKQAGRDCVRVYRRGP
jgi:diguanylate cyclase (GGDEF)-like protein/PAS domain S-box-containing protein